LDTDIYVNLLLDGLCIASLLLFSNYAVTDSRLIRHNFIQSPDYCKILQTKELIKNCQTWITASIEVVLEKLIKNKTNRMTMGNYKLCFIPGQDQGQCYGYALMINSIN